jgi:2-methylisocitrate lyase-like PEP mutase family enzyme
MCRVRLHARCEHGPGHHRRSVRRGLLRRVRREVEGSTPVGEAMTAEAFRALHKSGAPLVLFNIWDAGSARAVAMSGAKAIATSSWSVAAAHGFVDGERIPVELAIDNLRRIVCATELPVTVDLEGGYADVGETIALAIQAGAVGCNLEDSRPADGSLREIAEQCARIREARQSADAAFFINARTDVFLQPGEDQIGAAIARARAYAAAGADGIFVPGLEDTALILQLVQASPLPVNIMVGDRTPTLRELAALGVARVSHGPRPYVLAIQALQAAARAATA